MSQKIPCAYILTNRTNGVLYTGVTSNLKFRVWQHKQKLVKGFSKKYNLDRLVWYELHATVYAAITREKQIKKWNRAWKLELIESLNPKWRDIYEEL